MKESRPAQPDLVQLKWGREKVRKRQAWCLYFIIKKKNQCLLMMPFQVSGSAIRTGTGTERQGLGQGFRLLLRYCGEGDSQARAATVLIVLLESRPLLRWPRSEQAEAGIQHNCQPSVPPSSLVQRSTRGCVLSFQRCEKGLSAFVEVLSLHPELSTYLYTKLT